jgi:hypothetical protein
MKDIDTFKDSLLKVFDTKNEYAKNVDVAEAFAELAVAMRDLDGKTDITNADIQNLAQTLSRIKKELTDTIPLQSDVVAAATQEVLNKFPKVEDIVDKVLYEFPTEDSVIFKVLKQIPTPKDGEQGKDGSPDTPNQIADKLNTLTAVIDAKVIKNLPRPIINNNIIQPGPGGSSGLETVGKGSQKYQGINQLEFAGSAVTLSKLGDGKALVTITTSSSSLAIVDPVSGTVDGSNVDFVFADKPLVIISDGITYRENKGWTWSGSTATMAVPPAYDLFAY